MITDKGLRMVESDFEEPQTELDDHATVIDLAVANATGAGAKTPLADRYREILAGLIDAGYGSLDDSAVIKAYPGLSRGEQTLRSHSLIKPALRREFEVRVVDWWCR